MLSHTLPVRSRIGRPQMWHSPRSLGHLASRTTRRGFQSRNHAKKGKDQTPIAIYPHLHRPTHLPRTIQYSHNQMSFIQGCATTYCRNQGRNPGLRFFCDKNQSTPKRRRGSPLNPFGEQVPSSAESVANHIESKTPSAQSVQTGASPRPRRSPLDPFGTGAADTNDSTSSSPRKSSQPKPSSPKSSAHSISDLPTGAQGFRKPLEWRQPEFFDKKKLDDEMRRIFEICHGCRMCFNLCDSFPTLFDMIDKKNGSLQDVPSSNFKQVVDKCTLCDVCFLAKCPYVPPHPFDVDFPHTMLRYKIVENGTSQYQPANLEKKQTETLENKDKNFKNEEIETIENEQTKMLENKDNNFKNEEIETIENEQTKMLENKDKNLKNEEIENEQTKKQENQTRSEDSEISKDRLSRDVDLGMKKPTWNQVLLRQVDSMGKLGTKIAPLANWANRNSTLRKVAGKVLDIHPSAHLPEFSAVSFVQRASQIQDQFRPNPQGPSFLKGRKAVIYPGCATNFFKPSIGEATLRILANTGVETQVVYPKCCGMPQLEGGDIDSVAESARQICQELEPFIERGYAIVPLMASCALMFKQEWPNFLPGDSRIKKIAENTMEISEYVTFLAREDGLIAGRKPIPNTSHIVLHRACHSKAQNVGFKAQEMLGLIPDLKVTLIDRCSGHGGSFGVMNDTWPVAMKVGKPVFKKVATSVKSNHNQVVLLSDCPLAADHIEQGVKSEGVSLKTYPAHPIEILAQSYFQRTDTTKE